MVAPVFLRRNRRDVLYLQAKLLRFFNDGKFRRIGGDKEIQVDVRIISATHRNLRKMVQEGSFREDLFYRLECLALEMPPLRERATTFCCWHDASSNALAPRHKSRFRV